MGELGVMNSSSAEGERPAGFGFDWRSAPPPDPASFSEECLSAAEEAAQQVINCIHPTMDSEEKRRDVIDYVQRLIKSHLNSEVYPYGSVPLKTYLPDGDIDLTALRTPNADDSLAHDVLALIQTEEQNEYAEYEVKETQFIDAEVKLVKCIVENIVVDISFNQLGGLSTLCFLEQVDRLVGRKHLFKRSILLVKSWCYYESRILGAHHGLISTYALETLVLYIFHMFHASLNGPLEVLYTFLDYYSQFDWENYCISLNGPICKSSLPDIVVKMPEGGWSNKMLTEEFMENCLEMFMAPPRELEGRPKPFQTKHLNIIDPLKENNNLGRSVHRGNFYRIRSAFKYGARKLGQVLQQPKDKIADEIREFFSCTMARHGQQNTISIRHLTIDFSDEESPAASLSSPAELFSEEDELLLKSSLSDFDTDSIGMEEKSFAYKYSTIEDTSDMACDLATSNSSLRNDSSEHTSKTNDSSSLSGNQGHKRHYVSSKPSAESESLEIRNFRKNVLSDIASQKFCFNSWLKNKEKDGEMNNTHQWCVENSRAGCATGSDSSTSEANATENLTLDFGELDLESCSGESDLFNPLANLTGDYEGHIRSLLYGQLSQGVYLSASAAYNSAPSSPSMVQSTTPWDIVRNAFPFTQSHFTSQTDFMPMNNSNFVSSMEYAPHTLPVEYTPMNPQTASMEYTPMNSQEMSMEYAQTGSMELSMCHAAADCNFPAIVFPSETKQKARGTGTYFPNNGFYRDRPSQGRSRSKAPGNNNNRYQFHKHGRRNGLYPTPGDSNNYENGTHHVPHSRSRSQGRWRSEFWCQSPRSNGDWRQTNGRSSESCKIEFGSVGNLAEEVISGSDHVNGSTPLETEVTTAVMKQTRDVGVSIHLRNDVEFPPLCQ